LLPEIVKKQKTRSVGGSLASFLSVE